MITTLSAAEVWAVAEDNGITVRDAVIRAVADQAPDDLAAYVVADLTRKAVRLARQQAFELSTTPEQLVLFAAGREFPRVIHVEREDEEDFVSYQCATLAEVRAHDTWVYRHLQAKLGAHERGMTSRQQLDWPDNVPLGNVLFPEPCPQCGLPWALDNPFELMHDDPVAGRSGNGMVQWGHRSCNREAGAS